MRRRLLAGFLLLDGLCALAAPVLAPALLARGAAEVAYVEIAGTCVEEAPIEGADLAGHPVPMSFCESA